jgi:hypothetical protein
MTPLKAFIARYPVPTYFALAFAISWGGFVLVVGPGGFPGSGGQFETLTPLVASAMLAGPSVAGILLTGLVSGRVGLRELLSRLLRWRVGARWYAIALVPAPLLAAVVLFALSLTSPIFSTDGKAVVLLSGVVAGLTTVLEEVGWTGFAVPRLEAELRYCYHRTHCGRPVGGVAPPAGPLDKRHVLRSAPSGPSRGLERQARSGASEGWQVGWYYGESDPTDKQKRRPVREHEHDEAATRPKAISPGFGPKTPHGRGNG